MTGKHGTFYCLRCQHRFPVDYNPREVVERACPKCGSNSVRLEKKTAAVEKPVAGDRGA